MKLREPGVCRVDVARGELIGATNRYVKRVADLEGLYEDSVAFNALKRELGDEIVYEVTDYKPSADAGDMIIGVTRMRPGKVGREYFLTRGHIHANANRPEMYYGESGRGKVRRYLHNEKEAEPFKQEAGTFTEWREIPKDTDVLFYEGLHGAVVTPEVNVARHADLTIGVVPIINLEWIQKLHRDKETRGYSTEAVVDTILRRMPDYVNYICPQFSKTHVNFQRVPTVDTSNPFTARYIPTADESFVVIRFANPKGFDFQYLLSMIHDSFMSRPNIIVCPGGKMELAMQLILTPMILKLMDVKRRALGAQGARIPAGVV